MRSKKKTTTPILRERREKVSGSLADPKIGSMERITSRPGDSIIPMKNHVKVNIIFLTDAVVK